MTPQASTMPPRTYHSESGPSVSERVAVLETQVGDSKSGILGELNDLKSNLRAMEFRLYGYGTLIAVIIFALTGKFPSL